MWRDLDLLEKIMLASYVIMMIGLIAMMFSHPLCAQHYTTPIVKSGVCPPEYYASGNYCIPSSPNSKPVLPKTGGTCPVGWYVSGNYCKKS